MYGQGGSRDEINQLIRFYFDAKEDYRLAANRAPEPQVRDELEGLVDRREQFHMDLQQEITRHGVEMSDNGTTKADFKRDWERLRGNIAGHAYEAALNLAAVSEGKAIETAQKLLSRDLPPTVRVIIERHVGEMQQSATRISALLGADAVSQ